MDYICKKCGEPIKDISDYDLFEGMHWICFHFEFEHGSYDRDEPCDDISCPWNRISGRDKQILLSQISLRIESEMKTEGIYFELKEIMRERLPSARFDISIIDELLHGRELREIWFKLSEMDKFIERLNVISESGKGSAELSSISPDEFKIEIRNVDSKGHILINYMVEIRNRTEYGQFKSKIENGFVVNLNSIDSFIDKLKSSLEKH